jgi:hypothetical protein
VGSEENFSGNVDWREGGKQMAPNNVTYLSKEIIINVGISMKSIELVIAFCRHVGKLSCRHNTDMVFDEPTLGNVADMVCVVSATQSRHVGMYVVLGGKIPDTTPTFPAK